MRKNAREAVMRRYAVQTVRQPVLTREQIAGELGVSRRTLERYDKLPEFRELLRAEQERYIEERTSQAQQLIVATAPRAAERMAELINSPQDSVAYAAAKDVLDRVGVGAERQLEQTLDMNLNVTVDYGDGAE